MSRLLQTVCVAILAAGAGHSHAGEPLPEGGQEPTGAGPPATVREPDGTAEAIPADAAEVLAQLDAAAKDIQDVTARLVYEESIPLLEKTTRSRGRLVYKKPRKIILRLSRPRREDIYTNGKQWWVVSHEDKQVQVWEAAEDEDVPEAAFLKFGIAGGTRELAKHYEVSLIAKTSDPDSGETTFRLKFVTRKRPGGAPKYHAVQVEVSDKLWLPSVLVLEETGGEIVHTYRFSNHEKNTGVKDDAFDYRPPAGYAVVHPQESRKDGGCAPSPIP